MTAEPSAQTQGMLSLDADEVEVLLTHLAEMDVPGNYDAASEAVQEDAALLVKLYRAQSALLDATTARAERAEAQADEAMARLGGLTESIEQTDRELRELEARAERTEAERDKLRKVLVAVLGVMSPMTTAQQRVYYDLARDALEATQQPAAAEPAGKGK